MRRRLVALAVLLSAIVPQAFAQSLYKSVDPDGRAVYGDKPPAEGRLEKTMKFDNLPASAVPAPAAPVKKSKPLAAYVPGPPTILYTASWCRYCKQAKAYLARNGIAYQELDIDTAEGRASFASARGRSVPLLLAEGRRVQGFSRSAYDSTFANLK
jgi:glutaredoxin